MKKKISFLLICIFSTIAIYGQNSIYKKCLSLALKGDTAAQCNLASYFMEGKIVKKNPTEAIKWLTKAAENNCESAYWGLVRVYGSGMGVEKDENKANQWLEKLANKGNAYACGLMMTVYMDESGNIIDRVKAEYWKTKAAENGDLKAQLLLGYTYATGDDFYKRDLLKSLYWFGLAEKQGSEEAKKWIKEISDHINEIQK
jgi:FOG: TPR repeat, SEL1 subfamily